MMSNIEKKKEAYNFGKYAEEKACEAYRQKGYTILERNWHLGKTEIDIIARKDDIVAIIEVKARKETEDALASVTRDKRRRMIKAADIYLQKLKGNVNYRFDIVACSGSIDYFTLEIYQDAFVSADLF